MGQNASSKPDGLEGGQRIQLLSEVLRVHKERVSKGEVRFRKEVVTENQTVEVPVTREELVIDRIPAQAGTPASEAIGSNQEIRVPLSEEEVRVERNR
ncbi:MAG TPA: YsnF/AvaK domain-containing protein [Terriglobales bacterium]|nr:YsnF/AvaK domain-containing protein [Terriglobales bacterium]